MYTTNYFLPACLCLPPSLVTIHPIWIFMTLDKLQESSFFLMKTGQCQINLCIIEILDRSKQGKDREKEKKLAVNLWVDWKTCQLFDLSSIYCHSSSIKNISIQGVPENRHTFFAKQCDKIWQKLKKKEISMSAKIESKSGSIKYFTHNQLRTWGHQISASWTLESYRNVTSAFDKKNSRLETVSREMFHKSENLKLFIKKVILLNSSERMVMKEST